MRVYSNLFNKCFTNTKDKGAIRRRKLELGYMALNKGVSVDSSYLDEVLSQGDISDEKFKKNIRKMRSRGVDLTFEYVKNWFYLRDYKADESTDKYFSAMRKPADIVYLNKVTHKLADHNFKGDFSIDKPFYEDYCFTVQVCTNFDMYCTIYFLTEEQKRLASKYLCDYYILNAHYDHVNDKLGQVQYIQDIHCWLKHGRLKYDNTDYAAEFHPEVRFGFYG